MPATEIAIFAHACVTAGRKDASTTVLLHALAEHDHPRRELPRFKSKELANFLWAYGHAGCKARPLFEDAAHILVKEKLHELTAYDMAQIAVAYARLECKHERLFEALAQHSYLALPQARSMQDPANLLWAFAILELPHEAPFVATYRLHRRCHEYNLQELATVLWAFSHRRHHLSACRRTSAEAVNELGLFLEAMHETALRQLEHHESSWTPEGFSKVACAFSHLLDRDVVRAGRLMDAIARAAARLLRRAPRAFAAQDASWLAMAYAWGCLRSDAIGDFFAALSSAAPAIITDTSTVPQNLANMAWACGFYVEHSAAPPTELWHHPLFDAIASCEWATMKILLKDVAMVATGLAKGCYAHFAFFQQIAHRLADLLTSSTHADDVTKNLSILAWSFAIAVAEVAELVPRTFDTFTSVVLHVRGLDQQGLAMLLWACAVVEYDEPTLLSALLEQVTSMFERNREQWTHALLDDYLSWDERWTSDSNAVSSTRRQLQQYQLWVEHELRRPELFLPAALCEVCREDMVRNNEAPTTSRFQREVGRLLPVTGAPWESERWEAEHVLECGITLDWALPRAKIGVEADGPFHFLRRADCSHVPSGATLLKRRQLAALGWRVISVPLHEWNDQGPAETDDRRSEDDVKAEYLRELLRASAA